MSMPGNSVLRRATLGWLDAAVLIALQTEQTPRLHRVEVERRVRLV
jgi:hypothetical protein